MKVSALSIASVGVIIALHAAPANAQLPATKSAKRGTSSPTSDTLASAKSAKAAAFFTKSAKAYVSTSSPTSDTLGSKSSKSNDEGYVIVANRFAGSISFIDRSAKPRGDDRGVRVIGFGKAAEPMYPTTAAPYEAIYVSDRLNNGMWILDSMAVNDVSPDKFIGFDSTQCNGLFHSCKADNGKYVGNVCNGSNSLSFINIDTKEVTYVDLNEKSNENCQPHDIALTTDGIAYVSNFGGGCDNQLFKVDIEAGEILVAKEIGGKGNDPHLGLENFGTDPKFVFSPQQKRKNGVKKCGTNGKEECTGVLAIYDLNLEEELKTITINNAHGFCFTPDAKYMYVTDIGGGKVHQVMNSENIKKIKATGLVGAVPDSSAVKAQGGGITHNCEAYDDGEIYVTSSNPPNAPPVSFAVPVFMVKENEIDFDGFFVSDSPNMEKDSNPFGIAPFPMALNFTN